MIVLDYMWKHLFVLTCVCLEILYRRCVLAPILNAKANQRHSDESSLKRGVLFTCSLTEFSHHKQQSADVRTNVSKILISQCKQLK